MSAGCYLDEDMIYKSSQDPVNIPDNLDAVSFIFDYMPFKSSDPNVITRQDPQNNDMLICGLSGRRVKFEEAKKLSTLYARVFEKYFGLGWDDAISIYSPNDIQFPLSIWGAHRLGGIVSSANPSYSASELAYQLKVVSEYHPLKGFLVHPDSLDVALEAAKEAGLSQDNIILIRPPTKDTKSKNISKFPVLEDLANKLEPAPEPKWRKLLPGQAKTKLAFLSFSSGTTGLPKAVSIPHYSVCSNVLQLERHNRGRWTPLKDKALAVLPFYHIYGKIVVMHWMAFTGYPIVVLPKFSLGDFLDVVSKYKVNILFVVPPIAVLMVKSPLVDKYDLSGIKFIMSGAAPLTHETSSALQSKFPNSDVGQGYGLTETCTAITVTPKAQPGESVNVGAAGKLLPNVEIKIVDPETGKHLGFGERGELWTRGPSNALGYINNKKATQETWDKDGFIHTGDEAYIDKEGYLFITDRLKELIKTKGNQVAPAELEGFILGHKDVYDVCVIGIADAFAGELPKAYVVLTEPAAKRAASSSDEREKIKADIYKFVSENKIRYKWLDGGVDFVDQIPKNPSGKLLRRQLRDLHAKTTKPAQAKL